MNSPANPRRSRFAPGVLVLLALLVTALLYSAAMPSADAQNGASSADVAAGQSLFSANCAYCHGTEGQGGDIGPSLIGVGAAAVDFQVGTGRMPMADNSPQAPAKPPVFNDEQISQLAAYVSSLGPGPNIPSAEQVDPALGDPANGMLLFRTNCAMCHNAVGAGGALSEGKVAPSILNTSPTHIYEAMVTGPQAMPVFNDASIPTEGKRDIIAFIDAQNDVSPGGLTLGSIGPVSEGLWAWIVGMGFLILLAVWVGAKSS
ncbi:MAG TPA: cytochrome c [Actinomycetaceae bacterium]|nr:cytochrome c [Actinomycetaceae bacterium]